CALPISVRSIVLVAFFITFVSKFVFSLFFLIDDVRRGGIWIKRRVLPSAPVNSEPGSAPSQALKAEERQSEEKAGRITRSDFLARTGIVIAAVPFTTLSWGIASGAYDYRVRRQKLYLPNLPKAFHGMTIGQISDIHSGSFYNQKAVTAGVEMLLAQKPDMIFFTGDLVNNL